jgi:hypothetical protein
VRPTNPDAGPINPEAAQTIAEAGPTIAEAGPINPGAGVVVPSGERQSIGRLASLLQKAIRRGYGRLCTPSDLVVYRLRGERERG